MRSIRFAILVVALTNSFAFPSLSRTASPTKVCANKDADAAERSAGLLRNWQQVHDAFRRYEECDDGAIAEGYSESVINIFVKHWDLTARLLGILRTDPKFEIFVLNHVNSLMSPDQAQYIVSHARTNCPRGANVLCNKLAFTVENSK